MKTVVYLIGLLGVSASCFGAMSNLSWGILSSGRLGFVEKNWCKKAEEALRVKQEQKEIRCKEELDLAKKNYQKSIYIEGRDDLALEGVRRKRQKSLEKRVDGSLRKSVKGG